MKNTRNKRILKYSYNKYLLFFLLIKILIQYQTIIITMLLKMGEY